MSGPIDLAARRAARTLDAGAIKEHIAEGAETLYALVSGWNLTHVREAHIVGAERSLVALQGLLIQLRARLPETPDAA